MRISNLVEECDDCECGNKTRRGDVIKEGEGKEKVRKKDRVRDKER